MQTSPVFTGQSKTASMSHFGTLSTMLLGFYLIIVWYICFFFDQNLYFLVFPLLGQWDTGWRPCWGMGMAASGDGLQPWNWQVEFWGWTQCCKTRTVLQCRDVMTSNMLPKQPKILSWQRNGQSPELSPVEFFIQWRQKSNKRSVTWWGKGFHQSIFGDRGTTH